jgi:hypothetical protein
MERGPDERSEVRLVSTESMERRRPAGPDERSEVRLVSTESMERRRPAGPDERSERPRLRPRGAAETAALHPGTALSAFFGQLLSCRRTGAGEWVFEYASHTAPSSTPAIATPATS